jgi:hypothetical protein
MLAVAAGGGLILWAEDAPPTTPATPAAAMVTSPAVQSGTNGNTTAAAGAASGGNVTANSQIPLLDDLVQLQRFLSLSPERITKLREALETLDKMTPEERLALRQEVEARLQNIRALFDAMGGDTRRLSPPDRDVLSQYVMSLYPENVQSLTQRFQAATTPDDRKKIVDEMLANAAAQGIKARPSNPDRPLGGPRGGFVPNGRMRYGPDNGPGGPNGGRRGAPPPGPEGPPPAPNNSGNTTAPVSGNTTPPA